jgi:hypothetical protein
LVRGFVAFGGRRVGRGAWKVKRRVKLETKGEAKMSWENEPAKRYRRDDLIATSPKENEKG